MSLLSIVRQACAEIGITQPGLVVGSSDPQIVQILALTNREGINLASRYQWQALTKEATFTTVASENQGALSTIAPGLKFILNDTIWNRSLNCPVYGPENVQRWQQLKSGINPGIYNSYKIEGGYILFIPVPSAGQSCYFQYVTSNWTTQGNAIFLADTDTSLLDENLITMGLIWRWRKAKGFAWQPEHEEYEQCVKDATMRDGAKASLDMNGLQLGFSNLETEWPGPIINIGL